MMIIVAYFWTHRYSITDTQSFDAGFSNEPLEELFLGFFFRDVK